MSIFDIIRILRHGISIPHFGPTHTQYRPPNRTDKQNRRAKPLERLKSAISDWFTKNEADILGFILALPFIFIFLAIMLHFFPISELPHCTSCSCQGT